jgi:hypothetical protein
LWQAETRLQGSNMTFLFLVLSESEAFDIQLGSNFIGELCKDIESKSIEGTLLQSNYDGK